MSRKMTQYSAEFKTKIVLKVLKGDKTINEILGGKNDLGGQLPVKINFLTTYLYIDTLTYEQNQLHGLYRKLFYY